MLRRSFRRWYVLVMMSTVIFGLLLALPALQKPIGWDEAVYLSQLDSRVPAYGFGPQRSWGVPLLIAPLAAFHTDALALRIWTAIIASVFMGHGLARLGFIYRRSLPWAFASIGSLWVVPYYLPQALPNTFSAAIAVAVIGEMSWHWSGRKSLYGTPLLTLHLLHGLVRPVDAVVLVAACHIFPLFYLQIVRRIRDWTTVGWAAAYGLAVTVPWLAVSFRDFGTPLSQIRQVQQQYPESSPIMSLLAFSRQLDGPPAGFDIGGSHWIFAQILLGAMLAMIFGHLFLILRPWRGSSRRFTRDAQGEHNEILFIATALVLTLGIVAANAVATNWPVIRFLLPAWFVFAISFAVSIRCRSMGVQVLYSIAFVALIAQGVGILGDRLQRDYLTVIDVRSRSVLAAIEQHPDYRALAQPCGIVVREVNYPALSYNTGCWSHSTLTRSMESQAQVIFLAGKEDFEALPEFRRAGRVSALDVTFQVFVREMMR